MKQHQYRITLEHLANEKGEAITGQSLSFNAPNHDDLFEVFEKVAQLQPDLNETDRQRFVLGLKMLGEVVLENRDHAFFAQFSPFIKDMMMILKNKKS